MAKMMEEEGDDLFFFLCIYTIAVILVMKLGQVLASMAWAMALKIRERLAEGEDQQEVKKGKEPVSEESEEEVPIPRPKDLELINKENGPRTTGASSTTMASSSNEAVPVASRLSSSTLTFEVLTTKTGLVYHTDRKCQYLRRVHTGQVRESRFCIQCAEMKREKPQRGDTLKINDWGSACHLEDGCFLSRSFKKFSQCLVCQGNGANNAPTKR